MDPTPSLPSLPSFLPSFPPFFSTVWFHRSHRVTCVHLVIGARQSSWVTFVGFSGLCGSSLRAQGFDIKQGFDMSTSEKAFTLQAGVPSFADAVTDFFNKFDTDRDGHITIDELATMMDLLRKDAGMEELKAPRKAAELVLKALDSNANGMIELGEFVAWTKKGITLTMEKRQKFAKSAPERADLIVFITALEKQIPSATVESVVNRMFEEYDIDGNGHIDLDELVAMMVELGTMHNRGVTSMEMTRDSAKLAMQALDEDKNGTIEKMEFVDWIRKGLTMTLDQRNAFMKKGADRKTLIYFLEACELEMQKSLAGLDLKKETKVTGPAAGPAVGQKAGRKEQYQRLLHSIFMNYDNDGDLFINKKELVVMMSETIKQHGSVSISLESVELAAEDVMKVLDTDKNGKLDEAEFVAWVNEGMAMPKAKRETFAKKSAARAMLVRFLEGMEKWMNGLKPLESAVHSTFADYDIDEDGHITEAELQAMLTEVTGQMGDHAASIEASHKIMQMFDIDGNGLLEEDEFYAWVRKGHELNKEQRAAFASKGPAKKRMLELLSKLETIAETQDLDPVKLSVRNLFQKYDVDSDRHVDVDELGAMMTELMMVHQTGVKLDHDLSMKTADKVLKMLDSNKNGKLEETEFMDWIVKGQKMSSKAREKFAAKNAINAHMVQFLDAVEKELKLERPITPDSKGDEIRPAN